MASGWPHLAQAGTYTIQNTLPQTPEPEVDETNETTRLLHINRNSPLMRNFWITFFMCFLCIGLFTGTYLIFTEESDWLTNRRYTLIKRSVWKAQKVQDVTKMAQLDLPIKRVVFTETYTPGCSMQDQCFGEVHNIQNEHLFKLHQPDIVYNFLIAGDGNTYEGRGWNYQPPSHFGDNSTLVVAFLGNFKNGLPSRKQLNAAKKFLDSSESKGKLIPCYSILKYEQNAIDGSGQLYHRNRGALTSSVSVLQTYFKRKHSQCF